MKEPTSPPHAKARVAGLLYVVVILAGIFAYAIVPSLLVVVGDPAATAQNITDDEQLYRLAFVAGLTMALCNVAMAVLFWEIFDPVDRTWATVAAAFMLVATAVEASSFVSQLAALRLQGQTYVTSLTPELAQSIGYFHLRLQNDGFDVATSFFAFYNLAIGYLIIRSALMPRLIGALMVASGLSYLTNSLSTFLAPALAGKLFPLVLLPSFIGESSLALWLAIFGIKRAKRNELDA